MKVVVKFNFLEETSKYISISEDEVFIMEKEKKQIMKTNKNDRLTTLFNLFSFKNQWKTSNSNIGRYEILFQDEEETICCFESLPKGWLLFLGYISRLVGDAL